MSIQSGPSPLIREPCRPGAQIVQLSPCAVRCAIEAVSPTEHADGVALGWHSVVADGIIAWVFISVPRLDF